MSIYFSRSFHNPMSSSIYSWLLEPVHLMDNSILTNECLLFIKFRSDLLHFHILSSFERVAFNSAQFDTKNNEVRPFLIWLRVDSS